MFRKNVASQFIHFQGVDATTGGIKTGVTWTIRRCIDGTFAAGGGTVTEDGTTGWYKYAMSQGDTNGNDIGFNFTGTGAVPQTVNIVTTACDPTTATNFGITSLPTTACTTPGNSLITSGTGTDQLSVSGGSGKATLSDAVSHGGTLGSSTATLAMSRVNVTSQTSNTVGLTIAGNGTGAGSTITGGATGIGLSVVGGGTSGDGVSISTTSGHGVNIAPVGSSKHGVLVTGGNGGTSDGLKLAAGTGGVGFRLDTLTASGAVTLSSTLTVSGTTSLAAVSTSGTLTLNALTVTNATTLSGAVSLGSTLTVTGATSLAALSTSGTTTLNALTVTNATTLSGAVSLGSTLAVTGATTLAALSMTTLTASGAVAFQSTLAVTGTTTLTGAVSLGSTLGITGAMTLSAGLTLNGAAASGATPATSGLTITGGAASTTGGGTAATAITATGGAGAASTNGAASGVKFVGGGTNTVSSTAHGFHLVATSNGSGLFCLKAGSGSAITAAVINGTVNSVSDNQQRYLQTTGQTYTSTTISFGAGTFGANDLIAGFKVNVVSGTGVGQSRTIISYDDTTGIATIDRAWATTPDNSAYIDIFYDDRPKLDSSLQVYLAASQHVIVDSGTVTTLTNLPSIPANWLTAAGIASGALNGKGDWMLSYTQPTGFLAANFATGIPVSGDLSATMKTSVQTAADAAITANATIAEIEAETDGIAAIPTSNPTANSIADAVLGRGVGNVEDTADAHSLATLILGTTEYKIEGSIWHIYKIDGTTLFVDKTLSVSSEGHITQVQ